MRVLLVNSFYYPQEIGGAERSVRFIAESLVSSGHEVLVCVNGAENESGEVFGVPVVRLKVENLYQPFDGKKHGFLERAVWHAVDSHNPFLVDRFSAVLDGFKPDVVHTNTLSGLSPIVWSVAKARGVKIVHTLRDYYLLCPNSGMFKDGRQCESRCLVCKCYGFPRKVKSSSVDAVVGNSRFILNQHVDSGYFRDSLHYCIYNAYEPDLLEPSVDSEMLTFGYIGRLCPTKGVDVLILAFRELFKDVSRVRLRIAGDGDADFKRHLLKLSEGLSIEFLGVVSPGNFYSSLDWCVVPSLWHEPLARVLFESYAHGVPVVASNTGGTSEVVVDGANGFMYDLDSEGDGLKSALLKAASVSSSLRARYVERCLEASCAFRPARVMSEYLKVYQTVLSGERN